jgi:biotin operon repressor
MAVKNSNIRTLDHTLTWTEKEVEKMIKTFRKAGVEILPDVEKNFHLMVGEAQIRHQTHRELADMYQATVQDFELWQYRQSEKKEFKDPPATNAPDAQDLSKNWVKGFEILDNWIGLHIDVDSGIPLAFAIRAGEADTGVFDERKYKSLEHQYASRTRLYDQNGKPHAWTGKVQRKLWNILYGIFQRHSAYEYMRPFKSQPDGVGAYISLRNHYLGPNSVNNIAAELEKEFNNLTYSQETTRWSFEKYVSKHVELNNVAQTLVPHGYGAADEGTRVRRLIAGIRTNSLDTIKGQILSNQILAKDFDKSVSLFKDFIAQTKSMSLAKVNGTANVVAVGSGGKKRRAGKPSGKSNKRRRGNIASVQVENRYYTSKEYAKLSNEQKLQLKKIRGPKTGENTGAKRSANVSQVTIDELVNTVSSLTAAVNGTNVDNTQKEEAVVSNRNHPALNRRS